MGIHADYGRRGHLVFYDDRGRRIVEAMGPKVAKWVLAGQDFQSAGETGTDPAGYATTVVEVGVGTSEAEASDEDGVEVEVVTAANEDDGINIQHGAGDYIKARSSTDVYFGIRLQIDDATQSDFFVGLAITDTDALGGVTDGIYFEKLDGGTGISAVTEKDTSETQSDSLHTLVNDEYVTLEFYWNGVDVKFYVNDELAATHTAGVPDDVALRPTVQLLAGAAGAKRLKLAWGRAFGIG